MHAVVFELPKCWSLERKRQFAVCPLATLLSLELVILLELREGATVKRTNTIAKPFFHKLYPSSGGCTRTAELIAS